MQIIQSKLLNHNCELLYGFTNKDDGNLAFHVGDDKKSVLLNHQAVADRLSYNRETLVHMKQIHGADVKVITSSDNFEHPPSCDGIITDRKDTPLMVMVADCAPMLFFDRKKGVIAAVHAGRAGAFKNIINSTLEAFTDDFGSSLKDIHVTVGANIKSCCYEVGAEIYEEANSLSLEYALQKRGKKYRLDVNTILKKQLFAAGLRETQFEFSETCTACDTEHYYSYRAEGTTGRFAGIIMLSSYSNTPRTCFPVGLDEQLIPTEPLLPQ